MRFIKVDFPLPEAPVSATNSPLAIATSTPARCCPERIEAQRRASSTFLKLSARLTGQQDRLGTLEDVSRVADLKVTLFEVGAFSTGSGHFTPGESPVLIALLGRLADVDAAFGADQTGRTDLIWMC